MQGIPCLDAEAALKRAHLRIQLSRAILAIHLPYLLNSHSDSSSGVCLDETVSEQRRGSASTI